MTKPDVLQMMPITPNVQAQAEEAFALHKLWEAANAEAFVAEVGPQVRGVLTNGIIGADSDKRVQQVTRMLASAFFIRHLTDATQLADELEDKVKGTTVEDLEDPDLHPLPNPADMAATAMI